MCAKQLGGAIKYLSRGEIDARDRGYRPDDGHANPRKG